MILKSLSCPCREARVGSTQTNLIGGRYIELFVSPELDRRKLFNKYISTLKSRDMYPTEVEMQGSLYNQMNKQQCLPFI